MSAEKNPKAKDVANATTIQHAPAQENKRERMFEAEMLNSQLEQMQQYQEKLHQQIQEITLLAEEIVRYADVREGDELLVPLANGIFIKAKASGEQRFFVNIGAGSIVPKTQADVLMIMHKQLADLQQYEHELQMEYEQLLSRLAAIEKEFSEQ